MATTTRQSLLLDRRYCSLGSSFYEFRKRLERRLGNAILDFQCNQSRHVIPTCRRYSVVKAGSSAVVICGASAGLPLTVWPKNRTSRGEIVYLKHGIVDGPAQSNIDIGLMRSIPISSNESRFAHLRGEFFNAFNHPQFSNPNLNYGLSSFGIISGTPVNPRVGQLAVKLVFWDQRTSGEDPLSLLTGVRYSEQSKIRVQSFEPYRESKFVVCSEQVTPAHGREDKRHA